MDTDTNTQAHSIKILDWEKIGKRKRTITNGLYCEYDAKTQQLLEDIGVDGFVPVVGANDDYMIVTGQIYFYKRRRGTRCNWMINLILHII